jgi:hypothetical protein
VTPVHTDRTGLERLSVYGVCVCVCVCVMFVDVSAVINTIAVLVLDVVFLIFIAFVIGS